MAYGSPNACNTCHQDKDAAWADARVRAWFPRDYQAPVLHLAGLVDAARKGDWSRLGEMLRFLDKSEADPVARASLLRLLRACPDPGKWSAVLRAAASASPLVRAAAAEALAALPTRQSAGALLAAVSDECRVVRIRAAESLAVLPLGLLRPGKAEAAALARARGELEASLKVRPDLWTSQYNLGNHYQSQGDDARALERYKAAMRLNPEGVPPLVNASLAYARMGQAANAEAMLRKALGLDPGHAPAHFNMGLLKAGSGDRTGAERHLRAALTQAPDMAEAALNLGVLLAPTRMPEALALLRKAARLRPQEPRYAYTLAFFQDRSGDPDGAKRTLFALLRSHPRELDAQRLLREIQGRGR
jgi:tetratricopeptide (TPR) repeat protein